MKKSKLVIVLILIHIFSVLIIAMLYKAKGYTVTLDLRDEVELVLVKKGNKIERPKDPVKDGYEFDDWYSEKEYLTLFNFEEEKINSNITIYSKWNVIQYSVEYILAESQHQQLIH